MTEPRKPKSKSKSSLSIVERAYRGSLEEQYGHIVWLTRIMKGMGAPTALMLKGDAVMFAKHTQPRVDVKIGDLELCSLSHYESGIRDLQSSDVPVFVWRKDVERLQLNEASLVPHVQIIGDTEFLSLAARYDCIWYW